MAILINNIRTLLFYIINIKIILFPKKKSLSTCSVRGDFWTITCSGSEKKVPTSNSVDKTGKF